MTSTSVSTNISYYTPSVNNKCSSKTSFYNPAYDYSHFSRQNPIPYKNGILDVRDGTFKYIAAAAPLTKEQIYKIAEELNGKRLLTPIQKSLVIQSMSEKVLNNATLQELKEKGYFKGTPVPMRGYAAPLGVTAYDFNWQWKRGIVPYRILPGVNNPELIRKAIKRSEIETIMRFYEIPFGQENYFDSFVSFKPGLECSSDSIGKSRNLGEQFVTIGPRCGEAQILHELGHVFGFYHEQSGLDSRNHLVLNESNIPKAWKSQYELHNPGEAVDFVFDEKSNMLYPLYNSSAINPNLPTMTVRNPEKYNNFPLYDLHGSFSKSDAKHLKEAYQNNWSSYPITPMEIQKLYRTGTA